eukprot:gene31504-39634_t
MARDYGIARSTVRRFLAFSLALQQFQAVSSEWGWYSERVASSWGLNDIDMIDDEYGWAVGNHDTLAYTPDGGTQWFVQESGIVVTPSCNPNSYICLQNPGWSEVIYFDWHGVAFANRYVGWVVGSNGKILFTANGGTVFEEQ